MEISWENEASNFSSIESVHVEYYIHSIRLLFLYLHFFDQIQTEIGKAKMYKKIIGDICNMGVILILTVPLLAL